MADKEQLDILRQGALAWNAWREAHPDIISPDLCKASLDSPDLRGANLEGADLHGAILPKAHLSYANLRGANLRGADFFGAHLRGAHLCGSDLRGAHLSKAHFPEASLRGADLKGARLAEAHLVEANLRGADLRGADFFGANLREAHLCGSDLRGAHLNGANLSGADLSGADLRGADLFQVHVGTASLRGANLRGANLAAAGLVQTDLTDADLTGCRIYGVSAWRVTLTQGTKQQDLIITRQGEPEITVDNIEVAQFVYLLLHNQKIRDVIDTITSKAVLILGRFMPVERKRVLEAVRDELRGRNYLPIVFDFEGPVGQTTDETVMLLARMARFVIADLSDAKSVLQELRGIVPDNPSLAVQPLLISTQTEPGMFDFFRRYPWVLETHFYDGQDQLIADLSERVIRPAEAKVLELRGPQPG